MTLAGSTFKRRFDFVVVSLIIILLQVYCFIGAVSTEDVQNTTKELASRGGTRFTSATSTSTTERFQFTPIHAINVRRRIFSTPRTISKLIRDAGRFLQVTTTSILGTRARKYDRVEEITSVVTPSSSRPEAVVGARQTHVFIVTPIQTTTGSIKREISANEDNETTTVADFLTNEWQMEGDSTTQTFNVSLEDETSSEENTTTRDQHENDKTFIKPNIVDTHSGSGSDDDTVDEQRFVEDNDEELGDFVGNGSKEMRIKTVDVDLKLGRVRGRVGKTEIRRRIFYGFRSMRYAEPPKRFERAVPVQPWQGIYDATADRHCCIQIPDSDSGIPESEDCLFINVYTPQLPQKSTHNQMREEPLLLPVMFWIHGGAQMNGDSSYNYYGPDYFLEENVVVVTLNYRIGVFGFLSTGDLTCPGNNGLKDIILGLQWVQQHIERFAGNPRNVTIFGESAGAAMAMYLAQSPLTRGERYFNKVIAQSGNTLCPWSFQRNPRDVANRIGVATLCGLFIFDTRTLLNCLRQTDANVLKLAAMGVFLGDSGFLVGILNGLAFAPNIEPTHEGAAVTNKSYELLAKGDFPRIPYIMGINSEEALIVADNLTLLRPLLLQVDAAPAILVPTDMHATFFDSVLNVATQIRNFYFDFAPIILNSNAKIIKYLSDHLFDRPTRESVALLSRHAPVYYYRFSYYGKLGLWKTTIEGLGKVQHSADLNYIWRTNTKTFNNTNWQLFDKLDRLVRSRLVKMWTNFAKTGNPTPTEDVLLENKIWPVANAIANSTDIICMDIGDNLKLVKNPDNHMFSMWKRLYNMYGKPSDTY